MKSEKIHINPSQDLTFKTLFGTEENKKLLISFLNNILNRNKDRKIKNIEYLNVETQGQKSLLLKRENDSKKGRPSKRLKLVDFSKGESMDILVKSINKNEIDDINDSDSFETEDENFDNEIINNNNNIINILNTKLEEILLSIDENYLNKINKEKMNSFNDLINNIIKPKKDYVISIKATTKQKEILNIVIQMYNDPNICKRSLYYASHILSRSLPRGKDYTYGDIPNLIMINILNKNYFNRTTEELEKRDWVFTIKDQRSNYESSFKNSLKIYFIELPKFKKYGKSHQKEMEDEYPWILFLNDPNNEYFKKEGTAEEFTEAQDVLKYLQNDSSFIELYDARNKAIRDSSSILKTREDTIKEKQKIINNQKKELKEKDNKLKEKDNKLKEKDNIISKKDNIISEKDNKLKEKDNEINKQKRERQLFSVIFRLINGSQLKNIENQYEMFSNDELMKIQNFVNDTSYNLTEELQINENTIKECRLLINEHKKK